MSFVRAHPGPDGGERLPGEVAERMEPVVVVIRPDGSIDTYGYVGIIDQRPVVLRPAVPPARLHRDQLRRRQDAQDRCTPF